MGLRSRLAAFARVSPLWLRWCATLLMCGAPLCALSKQIDLIGPPGSTRFGNQVLALPNGHVVVSAPSSAVGTPRAGAVYLYGADGTLISTLTFSSPDDSVGFELMSLANGNFVVISPNWNRGRGAVTFVNGVTGLSGTVSANNSLVGSQDTDHVGQSFRDSPIFGSVPVTSRAVVGNGNYVIISNRWSDGSKTQVGAVTWCSGTAGCVGSVTNTNSLVGGTAYDAVGQAGVTVLSNGHYVVLSDAWDYPGVSLDAGAITWANGNSGITGLITPTNSLVGSHRNDVAGAYVVSLHNGHYVAAMPQWSNGAEFYAGAAVWGNGTTGIAGSVSSSNALIGAYELDMVGESVTALSNGHYVVCSHSLDSESVPDIGTAIWANGDTGLTGIANTAPALTGPAIGKGPDRAIALSNGNYVVVSQTWDDGSAGYLGAVTWANGSGPTSGTVSASNSLVGTTANDQVGRNVIALNNGNYVVLSPDWDGATQDTGAATWGNGNTGIVGAVSAANSLVGSSFRDNVGAHVIALSNGNYVAVSNAWDNASINDAGAATWGNGNTGIVGTVSAANSLIGGQPYDHVGLCGAAALSNGNYVVCSHLAEVGAYTNNGAVTWGNGSTGIVGTVSTSNSLYGGANNDLLGSQGVVATSDGRYVIHSANWDDSVGAITLVDGATAVVGTIGIGTSVFGSHARVGMRFDYDAHHHQLVVGRPNENIVSVLTLDAEGIFADGFELKGPGSLTK